MKHPGKDVYEAYARCELINNDRDAVLKWKGVNHANLTLKTLKVQTSSSICEIGGAEGTALHTAGILLGVEYLVNYDLTSELTRIGRERNPEKEYINSEFSTTPKTRYDIVILSDIIEHVDNESEFLWNVGINCKYALL